MLYLVKINYFLILQKLKNASSLQKYARDWATLDEGTVSVTVLKFIKHFV